MPPSEPFFLALRERLEQEGEVRVEDLLREAGFQSFGLVVIILALPGLVPGLNLGLAPAGGLAAMAIGLQLAWGVPALWIPAQLRRQSLHKGRIKEGLARLERALARIPGGRGNIGPAGRVWTGLGIAWTGLLLAVPVPLPFGNVLPAAVLAVLGAAILECRAAWTWAGLAGSFGTTVYFAMSFHLIWDAVARLVS